MADKKDKKDKETEDKRVVDLNDINFRNKDVMRWTKGKRRRAKRTKNPTAGLGLQKLGSTTKVNKMKYR